MAWGPRFLGFKFSIVSLLSVVALFLTAEAAEPAENFINLGDLCVLGG